MSIAKQHAARSTSFRIGMSMLLLGGMVWAEESSLSDGRIQREQGESEARAFLPEASLILRSTEDGTIQVLNSDGRVQETYPPGSLAVPAPSPVVIEQMEVRREEREQWSEEHAEQLAQRREEHARATEEAAAKKMEAEKARQNAEERAALEDAAIRVQDRRTGEYMMAVPVWRLPPKDEAKGSMKARDRNEPAEEHRVLRLYDRRTGRRIAAVPLESFAEKE